MWPYCRCGGACVQACTDRRGARRNSPAEREWSQERSPFTQKLQQFSAASNTFFSAVPQTIQGAIAACAPPLPHCRLSGRSLTHRRVTARRGLLQRQRTQSCATAGLTWVSVPACLSACLSACQRWRDYGSAAYPVQECVCERAGMGEAAWTFLCNTPMHTQVG
jgi:hypothetical protein